MRLVFTLAFLFLPKIPLVKCIRCYQCGIHEEEEWNCQNMRDSRFWSGYIVECQTGQVCSKTSTYSNGTIEEIRGCSFDSTYYGSKHLIGCDIAEKRNSDILICFCESDLCNSICTVKGAVIIVFFSLLTVIVPR
ncbi:uncharacterized protein LOC136039605 isoform X2 [Artemia franciscana]|uniref:uncharacterized protein LOC136039605 isoform X2 n=1 Tax=Artemia franciscana TaxID=6661 RepID=UPI0032DAA6E3